MMERLLSKLTVPSDVLQAAAYSLCLQTGAVGCFISTDSLNYMDVVVGSMRVRRSSDNPNGVSVADIKELDRYSGYMQNGIYFYRTVVDWYVGVDSPLYPKHTVERYIDRVIEATYPVYNILKAQSSKINNVDALTGCLTRAEFFKHIRSHFKTLLVKDLPLYIFYMDFNNFKIINDTLGHDMGDSVLRSIASEIKNIFLGYGSLYRVGGDEFIGIAFGIKDDQAQFIAKQIESVTRQAPCGLFVSISVGIKRFTKNEYKYDKNSIDDTIKQYVADAESGMYSHKKALKAASKSKNVIICSSCPYRQKQSIASTV